jgi:glycosyltransferase involved in cell wall biosynthesis
MAVGTPVVATRVGGLAETIKHGETGFLVEYGDRYGLRKALGRVFLDKVLGSRLVINARGKCNSAYCRTRYIEAVAATVRSVVCVGAARVRASCFVSTA